MMRKMCYFLMAMIIGTAGIWAAEVQDAAEAGNLVEVKRLLNENPALLSEPDQNGTPLLHHAISGGNIETVQYLLEQGADFNAVNGRGTNALQLAAYNGSPKLVKLFLDKGIDINAVNSGGFTAVSYAGVSGDVESLEILLDNGADLTIGDRNWGGMALHWACNRSHLQILQTLYDRGIDLNTPCQTDSSTPIFWATFAGKPDAVKFLLTHGVDVNSAMADGWTPLHNAVRGGHLETVKMLIEYGAQIDASGERVPTPFVVALENGWPEVATYLLDRGADINASGGNGETALQGAVAGGDTAMIRLVLDRGGRVNVLDNNNNSPLSLTMYSGNIDAARMLIAAGADVNLAGEDGPTPLQTALLQGRGEIAELLLEHGATIDIRDEHYNRTELQWAAILGALDAAELLLNHGADVNAVDNDGHTPLYYAGKYGHAQIASLLTAHDGMAKNMEKNFGHDKLLNETFDTGEAAVWYLGHCGFAIKTKNHMLIFDYSNLGFDPPTSLLANGHISTDELADQNVCVFVTHEHPDHYDTSIFAWRDGIKNITYVYGMHAEDLPIHADAGYTGPAYIEMQPHQQQTIDGMKVTTIASNDAGVGYLIEIDGLTIYHAGDHAGWREGQRDGFTQEIDYLAERADDIDFAFLNVTGCHVQDTVALEESVVYTLQHLHPKVWFPTHGLNREYVYRPFADKVASHGVSSQAVCAENRGDCFIYRSGRIL